MTLAPTILAMIQLAQNQQLIGNFHVQPTTISPGGTVTLTWGKLSARSAYITDLGEVSTEGGHTKLALLESHTFLLVTEQPSGAVVVSSHPVSVKGTKGTSQPWPDPFDFPVAFEQNFQTESTVTKLLRRVRLVFRDDLQLQARETSIAPNVIVIYSAFTESRKLVPDVRRVWRLAYRVTITPTLPKPWVAVSAAVQWRPVIDSRWFTGDSGAGDAMRSLVVNLRKRLQEEAQ